MSGRRLTSASRGNRSFVLSRFVSNLLHLMLGGALAVISLTLAPAAVGRVALGVGSATVLVTAATFPARGRGSGQRYRDGVGVLLGAWMIVAACAFSGGAVRWLSFAEAVALCALGLVGLVAHEAIMERAVRAELSAALRNGRPRPGAAASDQARVGTW